MEGVRTAAMIEAAVGAVRGRGVPGATSQVGLLVVYMCNVYNMQYYVPYECLSRIKQGIKCIFMGRKADSRSAQPQI